MPTFVATAARGLTEELEQELLDLGFSGVRRSSGQVQFESNWEGCYRANLCLRTASRVLLPVLNFPAYDSDQLYFNTLKHDFTKYIDVDQTFAIDAKVSESALQDQRYLAMKVKDAIADQFREKNEDRRPDVDSKQPDLLVIARMHKNIVTLYVDTSGDPLFKRGYRKGTVPAPLKETFAAGLVMLSGWKKNVPIVDPMCGSGTLVIEAAMMALGIAPGSHRRRFGFQNLKGFQREAWERVVEDVLSQEKSELPFRFYAFDQDRDALKVAKASAIAAGVGEFINFSRQPVSVAEAPQDEPPGIVLVNPPYGQRLTDEVEDAYKDLGFALRTKFKGWKVWVLSGEKDHVRLMGLKSSRRIQVFNGPVECRFLEYDVRV